MRKIVTKIPTAAELREIPPALLPKTLKQSPLILQRIQHIDVHYQPKPQNFNALFKFWRERMPSVRYYNPNIKITRRISDSGPLTPKISLYGKNSQLLAEFQTTKYPKIEQLQAQFKAVDQGLQTQAKIEGSQTATSQQ